MKITQKQDEVIGCIGFSAAILIIFAGVIS